MTMLMEMNVGIDGTNHACGFTNDTKLKLTLKTLHTSRTFTFLFVHKHFIYFLILTLSLCFWIGQKSNNYFMHTFKLKTLKQTIKIKSSIHLSLHMHIFRSFTSHTFLSLQTSSSFHIVFSRHVTSRIQHLKNTHITFLK